MRPAKKQSSPISESNPVHTQGVKGAPTRCKSRISACYLPRRVSATRAGRSAAPPNAKSASIVNEMDPKAKAIDPQNREDAWCEWCAVANVGRVTR